MSIEDRIARARVEFQLFRMPNTLVERLARELDVLQKVGRESRLLWEEKGRKGKRMEQMYLPVIGPSRCGKSTSIKHYLETLDPFGLDEEARPVVHVTLSAKATVRTLGSDILEEYADPEFEEGNATRLLRRAANHIEKAKTDLLILDEIHHLIDNDKGGTMALSVAETIKRMLIRGACPVMLVGTEDAMPLITKNKQLQGRAYTPVIARALDLTTPTGLREFRDHCGGFDLKLVEHKILSKPSGLLFGDTPAFAYDVSGGVIGLASRLFEIAAEKAMQRGGDRIEDQDLSAAVEDWALPMGITEQNPWVHGRKPLKNKSKPG